MLAPSSTRPRRSVITSIATFATRQWKVTVALLGVVLIAGVSAFGFGLDREGFPPINTPVSVVSGTWFVDDAERVDAELAQPLAEQFATVEGVESTETQARPSSFVVVVEFESGIDSDEGTAALVALGLTGPDGAEITYNPVNAAKLVGRYDVLVSVLGPLDASPQDLQAQAATLADHLASDESIETADVRDLVTTSIDPATGAEEERLTRFTRVALSSDGYDDAIAIGLVRSADSDLDVLAFDDRLQGLLTAADVPLEAGYEAFVTADFASGVRTQLDSLTRETEMMLSAETYGRRSTESMCLPGAVLDELTLVA